MDFNILIKGNDQENVSLFFMTYSSSAFSTVLGVSNFLKQGPCRIVPKDGRIGGFCTFGFLLLFLNILLSLLVKGFLIGFLGFELTSLPNYYHHSGGAGPSDRYLLFMRT